MYSTVSKYTLQCMISAVYYMLSIDSACGVCACCSVSFHSDCLEGQTDCSLDHCCATGPCGPFLGQQTKAGSVGHLSLYPSLHPPVGKLNVHTARVKPQSMSDQSEDTVVSEWIPFLPRGSTRAKEDKRVLFGKRSHI